MSALTEHLERTDGIINTRQHPELRRATENAFRRRRLIRVLPGTYLTPDLRNDWRAYARAACLWNPNAVITAVPSAALTFWPNITPKRIHVAARQVRFRAPKYRFSTRAIPRELTTTISGIRTTIPALTALDLAPAYNGNTIDDVLRERMATLHGMYHALKLTGGRAGNTDRRRLLLDSRAQPWSSGERLAHCQLRAADITRWKANVRIVCSGQTYFQDIAFDGSPVVAEVDGKVHMRPEAFEPDRRRGNHLLLAGKHVLHFTYAMLTQEPDYFISTIRQAMALYS